MLQPSSSLVMIMKVLLGCLHHLNMHLLFFLFLQNRPFDYICYDISSLSFDIIDMGKCLFETVFFVVGDSLLGQLQVLTKGLNVDVFDLLICQELHLLLHDTNNFVLLDHLYIIDYDSFGHE